MPETKKAAAGSLESSDAYVELEIRDGGGIELALESPVAAQFGEEIRPLVSEVLSSLGVKHASVNLTDRGALECTLRARLETAVRRAKGELK